MDTKLLFFDIDGTILNPKTNCISEETRIAIKEAQAKGHLAFINTGRTIAEIENAIKDIGFDGYVCGCGTYISYHGKVLLHHTINQNTALELIKDLHSYRLEAVFEGASAIYYNEHVSSPLFREVWQNQMHQHGIIVKTWDDPDIEYDKFCIIPLPDGDYSGFYEKYKHNFDFIDRGNNFYEIVPVGFTKATGIQFLQECLNIPHANTYAFGDSSNDLTMLRHVKHSIAMGNSSEDVLRTASYTTKAVWEEGIAHSLRYFQLI